MIHAGYLTAIVPVVGQNLVETIKGGAPGMGIDEVKYTLLYSSPLFELHSNSHTGRLALPIRPRRHRSPLL